MPPGRLLRQCWLARCATLCLLCRSHVLSASGEAWKAGNIDFTGAQMVATLKLIAVAMCYQVRASA